MDPASLSVDASDASVRIIEQCLDILSSAFSVLTDPMMRLIARPEQEHAFAWYACILISKAASTEQRLMLITALRELHFSPVAVFLRKRNRHFPLRAA